MDPKELRKYLFEKYSLNFNQILSKIKNQDLSKNPLRYVCPLCKYYFSFESLDQSSSNPLTIEHVPPESAGGSDLILTCKKCNNNHGSFFDSHLKSKLELDKFFNSEPGSEFSTSFFINDDIQANGKVSIDSGKNLNFIFEEKRTNPIYKEELISIVTGKSGTGKLTFKTPGINYNRFKISLLRAAYLYAFKKMGYAFLLNQNTEIVRKIIMDYEANPKEFNAVIAGDLKEEYLGLSVIKKPKELIGYLVTFKIKNGNSTTLYGILLPGGFQSGNKL